MLSYSLCRDGTTKTGFKQFAKMRVMTLCPIYTHLVSRPGPCCCIQGTIQDRSHARIGPGSPGRARKHDHLSFGCGNSLTDSPVHLSLGWSPDWCGFLCLLWLIRHFKIFFVCVLFGSQHFSWHGPYWRLTSDIYPFILSKLALLRSLIDMSLVIFLCK